MAGFHVPLPATGRYLRETLRGCALLLVASPATRAQGYEIWEFDGVALNGSLGYSVASAGDVDGDGVPDVIAGAPFAGLVSPTGVGEARVFSGATGALLYTFNGAAPQNYFGFSVSGLGDADGDGLDDLLVGAPWADPGGAADAGQCRVFSGATGASLYDVSGSGGGAYLGRSVAGVGDVNGDGVPDFAAGAAGQAGVRSGSSGAVLFSVAGPGGGFGSSVSGAGDVDADGTTDVIVGGLGAGQANVYSGATGALLHAFVGSAADGFGASVSGAGDVNGDSFADLLVGAPQANPGGVDDAGEALVFSGATGTVLFTIDGGSPDEYLGSTVAGMGDLDGDGLGDPFVVTAPVISYPGCYDCNTNGPGSARLFSGASGALLLDLRGFGCDRLGFAAGPAGDVNGDGVPDLLVGVPELCPGDAVPPLMGHARVISAVGLPPGTTALGPGCAGAGGFVPRISTFGGAARLGNGAFGLSISRASGGAFALLFAGTAPNPAGISIGGCDAYLGGSVAPLGPPVLLAGPSGAAGAGRRLQGFGIPSDSSLSGGVVHLQWAAVDLASPNGLFTTSDALSVTIQ
ncbi:MAG TPA: integrin alpha [Planctomycetota bacterium]|jgi:hypothetical protein|nr:integrin alpha [Planctomycetota bacterium]